MSILDRIRNSAEKEREEQARERAASLLSGSGVTPASDMLAGATRRNETKQQPQQQGNIRDRLRSAARYEAQQRAVKRTQQRQEDEAKKVAERKARYEELQEKITAYDSVSKEMSALMLNPDYAGSDRERVGELAELKSWFDEMSKDIDAIKAEYKELAPQVRQDDRAAENRRYGAYLNADDFEEYSKKGAAIPSYVSNGSRNYAGLTEDEKNVHNYLLAKEGEASANKFLEHMQETLNARAGEKQAKAIQGIDNDLLRAVATGAYGLFAGLDSGVNRLNQPFTDKELAYTATQYGSGILSEGIDNTFAKGAYDALVNVGNMAPSILASVGASFLGATPAVAGLIGSATMGVSAKGGAYKEGLERGMSQEQAQTYSTLIGASEGALSYLMGGITPLRGTESKMLAKVAAIENGFLRAIATGGVSIGSEIAEEEIQNYLEPLFRTAITGEEYDAPTLEELAYTALVTAMSTGLLESGNIVQAGTRQTANLGKELQGLGDDTVQAIIEEGLATDKDTVSRNLAQSMQDKLARGEKLTAQEVGALYRENVQTVESAPAEAQDPLEAAAREVVARKNEAAQEASLTAQQQPVNVLSNEHPAVKQRQTLEQIVKAKTGYGEEGVKSFVNLMEQNNDGNIDKLRSRFQVAYETGLTDAPAKMMKFDNGVQEAAFQAGKRDFALSQKKQPVQVEVNAKAGFVANDMSTDNLPEGVKPAALPQDVTPLQVKILDQLGKETGTRIRIVTGLKGNGEIRGNEALIDASFMRERNGKKLTVVSHALHEVGLHRLMQLAPGDGRAFINSVIQYKNEGLPANAPTVSEKRRDSYAAQGVNLTTEDAMEEISADAVWDLFGSDEAVADFLRKVDGSNNQQAKKGFQKFVEVMRDLVKKFKAAVAKLTGREKAEAKQALGELEDQLRIYETAFKAAVENRKGIENRAGQEYNGRNYQSYSLKEDNNGEEKRGQGSRREAAGGLEARTGDHRGRQKADPGVRRELSAPDRRRAEVSPSFGQEPVFAWAKAGIIVPVNGSVVQAEQATAMEYGIPSFVISDKVWADNGNNGPAFAYRGQIFMRETIQAKNKGMIATHEATHVMKQVGYKPYLEFVDRTPDMINMRDHAAQTLLNAVLKHRELDISDMSDEDIINLYDEFNATMYGHIAANKVELFVNGVASGVFYDFAAYSKELSDIHERFKLERSGIASLYDGDTKYSLVTDEETLDFLDNQKLVKVYRAMQEIDGKLYPPMAALIKGETGKKQLVEATEKGKWYQADEHPELIKLDKSGKPKFELNKGNGAMVPAAYNPYFHTSMTPLNDQFSSAYDRPNIVVVEGYIPSSELTSGYKAQYAKDSVGETTWHAGPVASKLKGAKARRVYLSRWFKADRVVPTNEVAKTIAETLKGENLSVPWNVVTPELRKALEKQGVSIDYKDIKMGSKVVTFESTQPKYSLKDSEGNELSKEQQEYFKDSKVRDENGNLLVMYHGTPNAGFTKFRSGSYFTQHKEWADVYQSPSASSISAGKALTNPDTYAVYLNIKKPFDTRNPKERRIFQEEFYRKWGTGTPLAASGLPDWIDGMDLQEFIEENEYDYDGLILDEGAVGGYGEEVVSRGLSYVTFSPEQVKNIDNKTPTGDPDIRFSLKTPVEEGKHLIAMHNKNKYAIMAALDLGGLPMPSIAIVKDDMGFEKFGDISLLFRKETISPTDRRNKVCGADAWTPTRPAVGHKVSDKVREGIDKKVRKLLAGTNLMSEFRLMLDDSNVNDQMSRWDGDYKIAYGRNEALRIAFLKDVGIPFNPVMKEHQYSYDADNIVLRRITRALGKGKTLELMNAGFDEVMKQEPLIRKLMNDRMEEQGAPRIYDKPLGYSKVDNILRAAARYERGGVTKEVDSNATRARLGKKFTKRLDKQYDAWLDELFNGIIEKKGIRNDKDWYTPSGNRRSFEQLYNEFNLQNIVRAMTKEGDKGVGIWGTGNIHGAATKEYSSIAEIRADSGRLVQQDEETHEAQKKAFSDRFGEITGRMLKEGDKGFGATLDAGDAAVDALLKGKTVKGILRELRDWRRFNATQEIAQDIYDLAKEISEAPTTYFEAKPHRAVGFDEVAAVVMPRKGNADLKARLEEAGVKVLTYKDGDQADRLKKINSVDNIKFSLKEQGDILAENAKLKETVAGLREQFQTTKFAKVDKKSLDNFTKKLLQDYESGAEINEIRDSLDGLYTYMANGIDGHSAVWEEAYQMAYDVALEVLNNAVVLDDSLWQAYKPLRDHLRKVKITLAKEDWNDLEAYGGYNEFRKANMGRLNLVKDGVPVDVAYQEMAYLWPEYFNEEEHTHPADQLAHMAEVLDGLQPIESNPYAVGMRESATWLANDIMERFFELPQAKPTFADKAERKLTQQVIKDRKKLEALREQKDQKIAKIIKQQREKTAERIKKEKADKWKKAAEVKEHYQTKEKRMSESRKARVMRAKIMRHASELQHKLLRPTDKQHVPESLRKPVAALLDAINLESGFEWEYGKDGVYHRVKRGSSPTADTTNRTKAFLKVRQAYEKILNDGAKYDGAADMVVDPDSLAIFDEVLEMRDVPIAEMTSRELETIWDAVRLMEHSVSTAGKMLSESKHKTTAAMAEAFQEDTATRKSFNGGPVMRKVEGFQKSHETPYTFFSHYGQAGLDFFQVLLDAQSHEQRMQDEIAAKVAALVSKEKRDALEKETVQFNGMTFSKAHVMGLYLLSKREQAVQHMTHGGLVQPEIGKVARGVEPRMVTEMDLVQIQELLTAEERKLADEFQKLTLQLAEWGNQAAMKAYGYRKFTDPHYWPIRSASEQVNQTVEKNRDNARSIANMGSAKALNPNATNGLEVESIFETFDRHASDMMTYSAWLIPMEDANRLFNFKFKDEDGNLTGRNMQTLLNKVGGPTSTKYWLELMKDIQNGIGGLNDDALKQIVSKTIGNVKKASVAGNLRVVVQQPTAMMRAAAVLKPENLARFAKAPTKGSGWDKAMKYAPIAARKATGGFEVSSNPKQLAEIMYKPETKKGKVIQGLKDAPLWAPGKADEITWGFIWNACEWQVAEDKSLDKGGESFYKATAKLFEEVIVQTQVVDGVLQRSQAMRSGDGLVKQMTAFMGEPTQTLNMVMRAYDNFRNETDPGKRTSARKKLATAATAVVFNGVLNAMAQSIIDATRDDDEEKEYLERYMTALTGLKGDEDTLGEFAKAIFLDSNLAGNLNPANWMYIVSDVVSLLQGYSIERMDASALGDFLTSASNVAKSFFGEGKWTVTYAVAKMVTTAGKLFGSSSANIMRDVESLLRTVLIAGDNWEGLYESDKMKYDLVNQKNHFLDFAYQAYAAGNTEAYEAIVEDMAKNGVDRDAIKSGMESRMKKAQGVNKVEDLTERYLFPDQEAEYDRTMSRIKSSSVWKNASGAHKDKVEDKLYEIVTGSKAGMDLQEKITEGGKYGIDETEYLLYTLALDMYDKANDNGKYGTYTNQERAEAILGMGLKDNEMAYLWDKEEGYEALAAGVRMEKYIQFKADLDGIKATKNALGKVIVSREDKIIQYLNKLGVTNQEKRWLLGTVYDKYK